LVEGLVRHEGESVMPNGTRTAGIKDIARALNLSIGTVDRALHNRPGVREKTKARVLRMAEQLGYRPNLAAQALKLNRRISIAAILPKHIAYFFDPLREGIRAAAAANVGSTVDLEFHDYPRLGAGDQEAFQFAFESHYDGIIFLPGEARKFEPIIRRLSRDGTAMMCVGSDAPYSDRIGSVAADAYVSGAIAAELLSMKLSSRASVAVFSGDLYTLDHAEKLRGFAATLAVQSPHLTLLPALESHEQPKEAYRQALALMRSKARPQGLYVSTANSLPVLEALDELGLLGEVQTITTDLYQALAPLIEQGKVLATMHQRPYTQGKLAYENLVNHLIKGGDKQPVVRLAPHIVLRSNLSLFSGQISHTEEEMEAETPRR
jgi:LacI family transcriptional regulator